MTDISILLTERLRLEPFDIAHVDGLNAMNSDAEVMRYIPGGMESREQTRMAVERVKRRWEKFGTSWWSFIDAATGEVVGAGCIQHLRKDEPEPDPAYPLEIGWRLRRDRWHQGLAFEAANAMMAFAFVKLSAPLLLAVCDPANLASSGLMTRLGMRYRGIENWYQKELATYELVASAWRLDSKRAPPALRQPGTSDPSG